MSYFTQRKNYYLGSWSGFPVMFQITALETLVRFVS